MFHKGLVSLQLSFTFAIVFAVVALGCVSARAEAPPVSLQLIDMQGKPIPNAVILAGGQPPAVAVDRNRDMPPAIMDQIDKAFAPKVLVIEQGRRVNFPNSDNIRHHVYSFSQPKTFELKLYAKQPEHPIEFEQAGIVVLGCNIHDQMLGFIVVSDTPLWAQTDDNGRATLAALDEVRIWHPELASGFSQMEHHSLPPHPAGQPITLQLRLKPPLATPEKRGFGSDRFRNHGR